MGRRASVRRTLGLVLLVGVLLGGIAGPPWLWGRPRRLRFDDGNAVAQLARATRAEIGRYEPGDVLALMDRVIERRVFVGRTEAEIRAALGLNAGSPRVHRRLGLLHIRVGVPPEGMLDGEDALEFQFDPAGRCVAVSRYQCC